MLGVTGSRILRALKTGAVVAALAVLAGCQSKNPIDYLPQASGGYMGMNMQSMKESAGLKRFNEEMMKMQKGATNFESDKAQKVYVAFDAPSTPQSAPPFYGVAVGMPGFADEVINQYKQFGATEGKTSGRVTYTSDTVMVSPVGDTGILFFQDAATLDRMINVSKKKEAGARASSEFNFVDTKLADHAMAIAMKAEPILKLASPMLTQLEAMNKPGVDALRQVTMLSLAFDWKDFPVLELMLHLGDKAKADALAGMINSYLTLAKTLPMVTSVPGVSQVVAPLQATSSEEGVAFKVEVPAAIADQLFTQIDKMSQMSQQQQQMMQQGGYQGQQGYQQQYQQQGQPQSQYQQGQYQQGYQGQTSPGAMPAGTPAGAAR